MPESFADILGYYVQRSHYSMGQVAALSDIPKRTIANWLGGIVLKPQQWQSIVKVAVSLKLNEEEASRLLSAAGHPTIVKLRQTTVGDDHALLSFWPPTYIPFQAVADLPYFVGRESEIDKLERMLLRGQHIAICNLHGMGGVGKTSLAAHLAYRLRAKFPDGILWARLDTTDTMTILNVFANAYGKNVSEYRDIESRSTVVRDLLADKQILIVLDNADNSEQVRPLLPPTTGKTAVIITTRHDLVVADQMHRFPIESFDPTSGESLAVFTYFLGHSTIKQQQNDLQVIADLLGHLPLAIAIAAGQLAYGNISVPDFLSQLQQSEQRLDILVREDRSVRLSFDLSYQALSSDMQRFFATLGVFGGDDFSIDAIAYVTHTTPANAQKAVHKLHHLSLIQPSTTERYRLHPLLRDYARKHIASENSYADMAAFYIELAESANTGDYTLLIPETSNILACLKILHERHMFTHLLHALQAFNAYLHAQGLNELQEFYLDKIKLSPSLLEKPEISARLLLDQVKAELQRGRLVKVPALLSEATNLVELCQLEKPKLLQLKCDLLLAHGTYQGGIKELAQAHKYFNEAFEIACKTNYQEAAAKIKVNQGLLYVYLDDDQAITYHLEALSLARKYNVSLHTTITCLMNLGEMLLVQGKIEKAEIYFDEAEMLAKKHGHRMHLIAIFEHRGHIAIKKGDVVTGKNYFNKSAKIARETDHWSGLIPVLIALSDISCQQGDFHHARQLLEEALPAAEKQGRQSSKLSILLSWGELYFAQGKINKAVQIWSEALEQSLKINSSKHIISAYYGLSRTEKSRKNKELAKKYMRNWQSVYAQMNKYEKLWLKYWLPNLPV